MAILGRTARLELLRFVDFGAYLDGGSLGEILLPKKQIPAEIEIGEKLEAFVYRDSEDRLIATTVEPYAEVGDCEYLEVAQVNENGAFLDWGLPKDLFVPFGEQRRKMKVGERHVVYLYIDNTNRIAGSSKLRKFLPSTTDEYEAGEEVDLIISAKTDLGYEAVVDDMFLGMVFDNDALSRLKIGVRIEGYIKNVRDDGKLDLSLVRPGASDDLTERILANLRESGGTSSITDKSSPDDIFEAYGVSKKVYKKAIGGLYKSRVIALKDGQIELLK